MGSALVSAARGLGDLLRVTPLVSVCARLGYEVDLLIAPDYADAVALFDGAPEIRDVYFTPSPWSRYRSQRLDGVGRDRYEVATFTTWSQWLRGLVRANRVLAFDQASWLRDGDAVCVERTARLLGWTGPLPPPFAMSSDRHFDIEPGTVALHPGCKPDWPWKKWHGFAELADRFPNVVLVGTESDLDNRDTYFRDPFAWPEQARNCVGVLNLADTAALLRRCAALVSNDSGLMHLGVALGIPTFGIFGITSQRREAMPVANMHPITKGLACEPACRMKTWGRRDCEHHLECLRSLTADEVAAVVRRAVPDLGTGGRASALAVEI